ncbi:MAG: SRPBCC family protein [Ilumatobacteraceae bacterium]
MMRRLTVASTVDAPPEAAWDLLTNVADWPRWGSSIASATLAGGAERVGPGATGSVTTIVGVRLPFTITEFVDGVTWRWKVAGVPATGHGVRAAGNGRCEVWFDLPIVAAPYAVACRLALRNIENILQASR